MLNVKLSASKSSVQINLGSVEQIVVLALEPIMGFLFNLKNHISGFSARKLIALSTEFDLGAALHAAINVNLQHLTLYRCLLSMARLAAVLFLDDLALAVAVGADGLETLDHRTHLSHHGLDAAAFAAGTFLDRPFLAADAVALRAEHRLLESEFRLFAFVDVFQADLVDVENGLGLERASRLSTASTEHATESARAAEELREKVGRILSFTTLLL
jgi:hypothetical protein